MARAERFFGILFFHFVYVFSSLDVFFSFFGFSILVRFYYILVKMSIFYTKNAFPIIFMRD